MRSAGFSRLGRRDEKKTWQDGSLQVDGEEVEGGEKEYSYLRAKEPRLALASDGARPTPVAELRTRSRQARSECGEALAANSVKGRTQVESERRRARRGKRNKEQE